MSYKKLLDKIKSYISPKLFLSILVGVLAITILIVYKNLPSKVNIVQGFPQIPVYPSARLAESFSDPNEGQTYIGIKYSATWTSKDTVSKIANWYIKRLKESGWKVDIEPANPLANDTQLVSLINDKYSLNMSFIRDQNNKFTIIVAEFSRKYTLGEPMAPNKPQ